MIVANGGAFKKGQKGGPGRPKGLPNKATANAREAIGRFVDANAERVQAWLDEICAEHGAKEAVKAYADFIEYHIPKLARTEHTGKDGGAIIVQGARHDDDI